jgi:hypothetical protein
MTWPIVAIVGLGLWHGVNPGMGWLFAVALGMQERRSRAVWRALVPLAAGHALAIACALAAAAAIGAVVPPRILKWGVGMLLVGFGMSRITHCGHPRYGGMRMNMRKLTMWSFLMASAHGAGLMVVPFVLADPGVERVAFDTTAPMSAPTPDSRSIPGERVGPGTRSDHQRHMAGIADTGPTNGWIVLVAHSVGYLLATGLLAVLVYEKLGLRLLRNVWFNLDLIWGVALAATGVMAPFV